MTRDELLQKVSAGIDETLYAYSHGLMSEDMAKESILTLIPPQPKLEWRGDELFNCGEAHMLGYIYNDRVGWWGARPSEHYIENPFTTEHEAKSAVEAAVRKALGMSHD